MAAPTRPQIEATITLPSYTLQYWDGATWVNIPDNDVLEIAGADESGTTEAGLAFGAFAAGRGTIRLADVAATQAIPMRTRLRSAYGFSGSDELVRFIRIATERERSTDSAELTLACAGFDTLISTTEVYTPLRYRRPIATLTTIATVEDPDHVSYVAGVVNEIFWRSGGRPLAQAATYPNAEFYYDCQQALITPEWSWVAGENAWQELNRLCQAAGGQVFQAPDGTMKYVNALYGGSGSYTFTEAVYESIDERIATGEQSSLVRCSYTGRRLQPQQIVYEDTTPRLIAAGASLSLTLEPKQPVYDYLLNGSALPADALVATSLIGVPLTLTSSVVSAVAGRIQITLTNGTSTPAILSRIAIRGRPIAPVEEGQASYGSGTPARSIGEEAGVYVQSRTHAERLCRLVSDLYSAARAQRTLSGCGYDPDRTIGENVGLTNSGWSLSAAPHRITAIEQQATGGTMNVTLVDSDGIPALSDMFLVGTSYSSGDVREISY